MCIRDRLRAIQDSKRQLYERYALGEIDLETYRSQKAVYDAELVQAKNVHAAITAQTKQIQSDYEARLKQREIVQEVGSTDVLTQSLIDRLINRVYAVSYTHLDVYKRQRIDTSQPLTEIREGDLYFCLEEREVAVQGKKVDMSVREDVYKRQGVDCD